MSCDTHAKGLSHSGDGHVIVRGPDAARGEDSVVASRETRDRLGDASPLIGDDRDLTEARAQFS